MAIVFASPLNAIEFPVWPWLPPPHAKWSYDSAFDALMYATCFSGSIGGTSLFNAGACASGECGMSRNTVRTAATPAYRTRGELMRSIRNSLVAEFDDEVRLVRGPVAPLE